MTCAWNWAAVDWEMYERTQAAVTAQLLDEIIEVQANAPQPKESNHVQNLHRNQ